MSLILTLPFIKRVLLLGCVSIHLFDKILIHFSQGPDNADVFMAPDEEDTQISEEVLKESKIIQEEIKSLLSEVCLVGGNSCNCKFNFCAIFFFALQLVPRSRQHGPMLPLLYTSIA
jgi:hypothetical protein